MTDATRCEDGQHAVPVCPYCHAFFMPKRKRQDFCSTKCRNDYHTDVGTKGKIAGVTRLLHGRVSVVTHFDAGPAAEHAIQLKRGDDVRTVKS